MDEKKYIEREAAIEAIWKPVVNPGGMIFDALKTACQEEVKRIHAADVRPVVRAAWKHVRWVRADDEQEGGYWISRCSNCSMPYHEETPFCPHCGADMRKES